jgi:hypothetical protein
LNFGDGEDSAEGGKVGLSEGRIATEPAVDGFEDGGMGLVLEGGAESREMGGEGLRGGAKLVGMLKAIAVDKHAVITIGDGTAPLSRNVGIEDGAAAGCAPGHGQTTTRTVCFHLGVHRGIHLQSHFRMPLGTVEEKARRRQNLKLTRVARPAHQKPDFVD